MHCYIYVIRIRSRHLHSPAQRQPNKTLQMRVIVREGENLSDALVLLNQITRLTHRRQWYKTRPGAYEKPSQRRRKSESRRYRNARRQPGPGVIRIYIGLGGLFSREEAFPWKRKPFKSRRRWWGKSDHTDSLPKLGISCPLALNRGP